MGICRIHPPRKAPSTDVIGRLCALPTSLISDAQERVGGGPGIDPITRISPGTSVGGSVLTVRTRAGDNLAVHQALRMIEPDQVLVVDAGGATDRAIFGEIMARFAVAKQVAAVVIDGAVRDQDRMDALGLPVLARAVTHLGPYKDGPGEIGCPINVGGVVAQSGDVLVADADGFVIIEAARAEVIAERAEQRNAIEEAKLAEASAGASDYSWIDDEHTLEYVTEDLD